MKKILFVNSTLSSGGSEKVMTILANEISKLDYDVSMVLVRENEVESYQLNEKVNLIRFKYKHKKGLLKVYERIRKVRQLVKTNNYDVIISFMHEINTAVLISTLGLKVPIIVSERCDPSQHSFINRTLDNIAYIKAKKIVLQTNFVKKMFPKFLSKKMVIIPNPLASDNYKTYTGKRKNIIVSVGRLDEQKNFNLLIGAFEKINKKYPNYELYIYGEGHLREKLEEKIMKLNLTDKVHLPGYVKNVNKLIEDAKIYVCSSNYEGISNAMLEALAMGIPTISTDCPVGGAKMVISNYNNGILIPVGDSEKLVKSMLDIINNPKLEKKLSENATLIKNRFNAKKISEEWINLIEECDNL